jgi:hypothetical protein
MCVCTKRTIPKLLLKNILSVAFKNRIINKGAGILPGGQSGSWLAGDPGSILGMNSL